MAQAKLQTPRGEHKRNPRDTTPAHTVFSANRGSLKAFAVWSGYGQNYVSNMLDGTFPPSAAFRKKVAEFLGLPEEDLFPVKESA